VKINQKMLPYILTAIVLAFTLATEARAEFTCDTSMKCLQPADANSKETLVTALVERGLTYEEIMSILAFINKDK